MQNLSKESTDAIAIRVKSALLNADPKLIAALVPVLRKSATSEAQENAVDLLEMVAQMVVTLANDVTILLEDHASLSEQIKVYQAVEEHLARK